jgi:hypothetical protein
MLAFVFGLCRWSFNFGRSLVVYYRIAKISRLNLACTGPLKIRLVGLPRPYSCKKKTSSEISRSSSAVAASG